MTVTTEIDPAVLAEWRRTHPPIAGGAPATEEAEAEAEAEAIEDHRERQGYPERALGTREGRWVLREASKEDGKKDKSLLGVLEGHFAVFNRWTEIDSFWEGRFMERVAPGAFSKTFAENRKAMRCLFQHGKDPQIGMKVLGPIRTLEQDDVGAGYEVDLLDTSYNRDLEPGLRSGLYGASFRFQIIREEMNDEPERSKENPDGIPERTIKEARVSEFGPVTFGAYDDATAGLRSLNDQVLHDDRQAVYEALSGARADRVEEFLNLRRQSERASHEGRESERTEAAPSKAAPQTGQRLSRPRSTLTPSAARPLSTTKDLPKWKLPTPRSF